MSRIGLKPIEIPGNVEVNITDTNLVEVKGPKGSLSEQIDPAIVITRDGNTLTLARKTESKRHKSLHGLSRTLIFNMVEGVVNGYQKKLLIEGTGYRAAKNGKTLTLNLGFSHTIDMVDPDGIEVEVPQPNTIIVKGYNKQQVGNYAAIIRAFRQPEPYKGKGVRYEGEYVRRKVGKTGK